MGLKSKFWDWYYKRIFATHQKANPIGRITVSDWSGGLQPYPADLASHGRIFAINIYAFASQRAIAQDLAATPLKLQERKLIEGKAEWIDVEGGNLFELFNWPNPKESWGHLSERVSLALDGTGNGYLIYTEDEGGEFYYVRPDLVKVKADSTGQHVGYEISDKGIIENFDTDELIHFKLANPYGEWYGWPASRAIEKTILTKLDMNEHLRAFFQNFGQLGIVLSTDQDLTTTQREELHKEVGGKHRGVQKWFKEMILSNGLTLQPNAVHALKELIPVELDKMLREEVLACYKVPPVKLGVLDGATYANAEMQEKIYQQGTMEPRRYLIETTLTDQFLKPRFKDKFRVHYDRSGIVALKEDRDKVSIYVSREFSSTLITRNEAREKLGYEPIEDGFGEEYYTPISPFDIGFEEGDAGAERGFSKTVPGRKAEGVPQLKKARNSARARTWRKLEARNKKRAAIMFGKVANFLEEQRQRVVQRINEITSKGAFMSVLRLHLKNDIPDDLLAFLFNLEDENGLLARELESVLESLSEQAGQDYLDAFNIDFEFNVRDPRVQNIIGAFLNRIKRINESTWVQLRQTIQHSLDSGDSIETLAEKIAEKYTFTKERARTIAKTEANTISNASAMEGYRQADVKEKEWLSVQDDRVRDIHAAADGQIRNINEPFEVGGELLMQPGDPAGSAENVIQCRCAVVPVVK